MIQSYYNSATDFDNVYQILADIEVGGNIIDRPNRNDYDSFRKWLDDQLRGNYHDFFVFREGTEFIGVSYTYDFKLHDGHCCMSVGISENHIGSGSGAEVALRMISVLFNNYPLNKIFFQVYEHNVRSTSSIIDAGLKQEAKLSDYHYYRGKYEDLIIYSLSRSDYETIVGRLAQPIFL